MKHIEDHQLYHVAISLWTTHWQTNQPPKPLLEVALVLNDNTMNEQISSHLAKLAHLPYLLKLFWKGSKPADNLVFFQLIFFSSFSWGFWYKINWFRIVPFVTIPSKEPMITARGLRTANAWNMHFCNLNESEK